jgi:hypothetical protein
VAHQVVGKAAVAGLTISQALTSSHIDGHVRSPDLVSQSHSHPPLYREAGECETKVKSVQKDMFAHPPRGSHRAIVVLSRRGLNEGSDGGRSQGSSLGSFPDPGTMRVAPPLDPSLGSTITKGQHLFF